jgi:hypothetical protein
LQGTQEKIPDYFIFLTGERLRVAVVEMKSGGLDVMRAIDQIQSGAKVSERLLPTQPVDKFYPVLLSGGRTKPFDRKALGRNKIRFQGKDYFVILKRCGVQLRKIIKES